MSGAQARRGQKLRSENDTTDGYIDSDSGGRSASNAESRVRNKSCTVSQTSSVLMKTARAMQQPETCVQQDPPAPSIILQASQMASSMGSSIRVEARGL